MTSAHGVMRLPGEIVVGEGARHRLPQTILASGSRAFVVADPVVAELPEVTSALAAAEAAGVQITLFTGVVAELPLDVVDAAGAEAADARPDVVVGIGGGSALDLAKLCALLLTHGGPVRRFVDGDAVPGPVMPLVAVPATAGTGSEVTPVAVVKDPRRALKVGISSPHLVPAAALCDPQLTTTCPPTVTAHAGIDALTHAIEGLTARQPTPEWSEPLPLFVGSNVLSDPLALAAVGEIGPSLGDAVRRPEDPAARAAMMRGSLLAGIAFAASGTHLSHALQYPIGEVTRTSHGLGVGLLLPYVMQWSRPVCENQLADVGTAWGDTSAGRSARADAAIQAVVDLRARIGVPHRLQEIGLDRDDLPGVAKLAAGITRLVGNAPMEIDEAGLLDLLEDAWAGRTIPAPDHPGT